MSSKRLVLWALLAGLFAGFGLGCGSDKPANPKADSKGAAEFRQLPPPPAPGGAAPKAKTTGAASAD
jgi:hypothetical protein